jgi:tetratricopeptide (TPR) repeat protein
VNIFIKESRFCVEKNLEMGFKDKLSSTLHKFPAEAIRSFGKGLLYGSLVVFVGVGIYKASSYFKHVESVKEVKEQGLVATTLHKWHSIQEKVKAFEGLETENQQLTLENAKLEAKLFELEQKVTSGKSESKTRTVASQAKKLGATTSVAPEAIGYQVPDYLLPHQLFVLGIQYLEEGSFERSSKVFEYLATRSHEKQIPLARLWMLAGISWFKVKNYQKSNQYFDQILKDKMGVKSPDGYYAQAKLWKALVAERLNKKDQAQAMMLDLLEKHPYSKEVEWVNKAKAQIGGKRAPSSDDHHPASHH